MIASALTEKESRISSRSVNQHPTPESLSPGAQLGRVPDQGTASVAVFCSTLLGGVPQSCALVGPTVDVITSWVRFGMPLQQHGHVSAPCRQLWGP